MRARIPALVTAATLVAALAAGCTDGAGDPARPSPSPSSPSAAASVSRPVTVTFTVRTGDLAAATTVLRARLDALGLSPDAGATSGRDVTFHVTRRLSAVETPLVSAAGHLAFRPVLETLPADRTTQGTAGAGDCGNVTYLLEVAAAYGQADDDASRAVACDIEGDAKYVLGPAEMTGADVASARADPSTNGEVVTGQWVVMMDMRSAADWAALTEKYVGQQLAIVLDGVVHAAPHVEQRIPDGSATLSGSFSEESAKALAAVLRGGGLPVRATVTMSG